jgi:hypothetical protein
MKFFKKIINNRLFYGLISLIFVYVNYSQSSWIFFNDIGGLVWAKIGPEINGIIFFAFLSFVYIKTFYKNFKIKIEKSDLYALLLLTITIFIFRYKHFYTYFWKDDFYFFFNRLGNGYSFYTWGPWLSSFPAFVWETIRHFFGMSIFPYQFFLLLLHLLLSVGVFFFVKYISKNYFIGLLSSFLVITTTISFEAFNYFMNPINIAWQGFFVCISLIALIWEVERNKGKSTPYLSLFVMVPAFMTGIARIGVILPLITIVDFLITVKYLKIKKIYKWIVSFVSRQWIFYASAILFFTIRDLWFVGTKTEIFTASLTKIYLYVVGIFSFPVEFYVMLSKLTPSHIPAGLFTVAFGLLFQIAFILFIVFCLIKKKKIPLVISIGFFWVIVSAVYFTKYGPHLPATDREIDFSTRTHHLAYLSSIGALMIWAHIIYYLTVFLNKIKKPYGQVLSRLFIFGLICISYRWLSKQYDNFLEIPKDLKITRIEFFYETYKKYIPFNAKKIYIFYDDGYLKRKDNYKPLEYYFQGLWNDSNIKILTGDNDLKKFINNFQDKNVRNEELNNIYAIYTDYDNGLIEKDFSNILRENITNQVAKFLPIDKNLNAEIINNQELKYFKNPVLIYDELAFSAILTPKFNIKLNINVIDQRKNYIDLRATVMSKMIGTWNFPTSEELNMSAKYYFDNPLKSVSDFKSLNDTSDIKDKMVCGPMENDDGILFLISWVGTPEEKGDQYFYSLCYFPQIYGYKDINIDLPYTGSILRKIVIQPLTKYPISIQVIESSLKIPRILE